MCGSGRREEQLLDHALVLVECVVECGKMVMVMMVVVMMEIEIEMEMVGHSRRVFVSRMVRRGAAPPPAIRISARPHGHGHVQTHATHADTTRRRPRQRRRARLMMMMMMMRRSCPRREQRRCQLSLTDSHR